MKKKIFALIAFAAAFVGCSKEASETPSPALEGQKFVITASVGDPVTRLGYTENDKNGFTAKFTSSEKISLYFLKADNSVALSRVLSIDGYSISDDGRTAKFETTDLTIPTDAVKLAAYLYSGTGSTYTDEKATTDLSLQANLGAAQSHHILYATANASDIKVDENGASVANLKFAYKTALLRFTLTFPEDVKVTMDNKTVITLGNANGTIHNALDVVWGELAETSAKGDIVFYPTDTLDKKNVAVAYACVWAGDNFKDSNISVAQGDDTYSVNLELKKETLEAGKVYDVTRTLNASPKPVTMWANDDAASADFKYSAGEEVTNDWLSCKDGKVSWTANTTGAPRTAKLSFKNGASFELTQLSAADFKGNYSLWSKRFATSTAPYASSDNNAAVETPGIVFGEPLKGETLSDVDGKTYTNQIGVKGLYYDGIMDATVSIDYEAMTARVGMFLDARSTAGQLHNSGKLADYPYVCFLPGMGTTTSKSLWAAPWNFVQPDLSTTDANDYTWLWFTVSSDFKTLNYTPNTSAGLQYLNTDAKTSANAICAITVAVSKSADISAANVRSDWDAVYQGNKFSNNDGITFIKK